MGNTRPLDSSEEPFATATHAHDPDGAHGPGPDRVARKAIGETWLKTFGWTIDGGGPEVEKAVVIAAPHTSNWDLGFTLAIAFALDLDIRWMGKDSLFKGPFGMAMKGLGGLPVDRSRRTDAVKAAASLFDTRDELLLLVPPEGTRSLAPRWKTGFYYIALEAKVPIIMGFLDFGAKRGGLGELLWPTGDIDADFAKLKAFYEGKQGKHPALQGRVDWRDRR